MRISDWSSDVCSSDLRLFAAPALDMRIIEHRSDPLKDAPGRFRDCEPDRRESIADHHSRNLIDRRTADGGKELSVERCHLVVTIPLVCLTSLDSPLEGFRHCVHPASPTCVLHHPISH